ncbi:hypothetical protein [Massilia yuzhufengensis]|nr:hypothetical protein [Massilia yuzhufengensis]
MSRLSPFVLALPLLLGGCATVSDSPQQQLELHAVLDYREVGGVGCILSNDMGRWFVVAPGRVTVTRSTKPLSVSCKKDGAVVAQEQFGSRADVAGVIGNVVVTAGVGHLVDRYTGAGFSYPQNLTVVMEAVKVRDTLALEQRVENPVF